MPTMPLVGDDLAGYRLLGVVGRGGMSVVYRAENPRLGSTVALKVLAPEIATNDLFRTRFLQESRIAASLSHPNVIPIYDMGSHGDLLFIAMRYVNGHDMRELLRAKIRLPPSEALYLVGQGGRALDYAHRHDLVHRDVKPANLLVEPGVDDEDLDHVFLADFGITKHALSRTGLTPTGQFMGTLDYVAPEQIQGKEVGKSADIYSLGCVLYEALTGQVPFVKDIDAAVLWAHVEEPAPPPSTVNRALPTRVDDVIGRALAKDPADRYSTCHELVGEARAAFAQHDQTTALSHAVAAQPRQPAEDLERQSPRSGVGPDARPEAAAAGLGEVQHARAPDPAVTPPPSQSDSGAAQSHGVVTASDGDPRHRSRETTRRTRLTSPALQAGPMGRTVRRLQMRRAAGAGAPGAVPVSRPSSRPCWWSRWWVASGSGRSGATSSRKAHRGAPRAGASLTGPGASDSMSDSMSPSATANPLVGALRLANAATGGMLPAHNCTPTGMDAVAATSPTWGSSRRGSAHPSLGALYAA